MFVAVYRWRLKPGAEAAFTEGWQRITAAAIERCGSGGSSLFKGKDGSHVAIARWDSRDARDLCFSGDPLDEAASRLMHDAVAEHLADELLDGVLDLWTDLKPV